MEKQTRNYGPLPFLEREGLFINDIPIHVSDGKAVTNFIHVSVAKKGQ
jgi:hypothetical protein